MAKIKQGGGGAKKHGRNKEKSTRYKAMHVSEKNKLKKVLSSSGIKEATLYAKKYNLEGYLNSILTKQSLLKNVS